MLLFGSEIPGRIVSTLLEGSDPQELVLPLKRIFFAAIVRDGIVASDKERIVFHNGRSIRDLRWIKDRVANSDRLFECRGFWVNGPELYVEVNHRASASGTGSTNRWIEAYNFETDSWHQVSGTTTLSSTGAFGVAAGGSFPFSHETNFLHIYSDGSWRRMFAPPNGYNPFSQYRQTSGAQTGTGNEFEATGTYTSTAWELTGLEGWPKTISRIIFLGDVDAGGTAATAATVRVRAGDPTAITNGTAASANFVTGLPTAQGGAQITDFPDNQDLFYRLQVEIRLARTTASTRFTPNGLPVIIEGFAFPRLPALPTRFLEDVSR